MLSMRAWAISTGKMIDATKADWYTNVYSHFSEATMLYLPCTIAPGGFSGELAFELDLPNGSKHLGLAARRYFWTRDGKPVHAEVQSGTLGFVRARILDEEDDRETVLLAIPDGEVVSVPRQQLIHSESAPHVPVRP